MWLFFVTQFFFSCQISLVERSFVNDQAVKFKHKKEFKNYRLITRYAWSIWSIWYRLYQCFYSFFFLIKIWKLSQFRFSPIHSQLWTNKKNQFFLAFNLSFFLSSKCTNSIQCGHHSHWMFKAISIPKGDLLTHKTWSFFFSVLKEFLFVI